MAQVIITAIVGSGGVVGLFFYFFRKWLEKLLDENEAKRKAAHEYQVRLDELMDKKDHCYGRMFFWVYKALKTGEINGDLQKAFDDLQKVEEEIKAFDRHRLSEIRNE